MINSMIKIYIYKINPPFFKKLTQSASAEGRKQLIWHNPCLPNAQQIETKVKSKKIIKYKSL